MSHYIPGEINVNIEDNELYSCDNPSQRLGYLIKSEIKEPLESQYLTQINLQPNIRIQKKYETLSNSHLKKKIYYDSILKLIGIETKPKVNNVLIVSDKDILSDTDTLYELLQKIKQTFDTDEYSLLKQCVDCKSNYYPIKMVTESITNSNKDLGKLIQTLYMLQKIMNNESQNNRLQVLL